ncbi:MAG: MFS transporter [Deltaproteobacteria bacterium]|nr:MFS transporter [Deltaproteobacteria bacterium]MBW2676686.1 MFS transporter [Deltaproteobacteria bacterium]
MLNIIKSFLALLIATTFLTMGIGLLNSLLSINMRLQGSGNQTIGLVMSCNYLGIIIGIYFCQPIIQHVGHIRAFAAFGAVVTAISLLHGLYMSPWFWAGLRIGFGLCVTGLFMVIESWLNEKVEPVFRGRLLSIYMILVYFGLGSGQLLLNLSDVQGKNLFMIAAIVSAVCLVPISITRAVNPQPLKVPRYNMVKLFQLAPLSMVGSFTAGLINSSFYALGPIFGLDIGLQVSQVSLFMSITVWAGLLFQYPVGLLSDRLDRLTVLSAQGFLVAAVSLGIAMLGRSNLGTLLPMTACFGVVFTIYPVSMARAQDNIEKQDIVPVSAALILFFGIGACFGPVTSSLIISKVGPWGLYYFTAACGGTLGVVAWIYRHKLPSNVEDQVAFVPIPRTSPVVSHFDPRGEAEGFSNDNDDN